MWKGQKMIKIDSYLKVFLLLFVVCFVLFHVAEIRYHCQRNAVLQAELRRLAEFNYRFINGIQPETTEDTSLWQRYLNGLSETNQSSQLREQKYYYDACAKMDADR